VTIFKRLKEKDEEQTSVKCEHSAEKSTTSGTPEEKNRCEENKKIVTTPDVFLGTPIEIGPQI